MSFLGGNIAKRGKANSYPLKIRPMLEEVQVTPGFLLGVVDLARFPAFRAGKGRTASKVQKDVQLFRRRIELRITHKPRVRKTQRHLEKGFFIHPTILYYPLETSKSHIFYSSFWKVHQGAKHNLNVDMERNQLGFFIPIEEYIVAMDLSKTESLSIIVSHVLYGLNREGLIGEFSSPGYIPGAPSEKQGITIYPMPIGVELFLFAQGISTQALANVLTSNLSIPKISGIVLPEHPRKGESVIDLLPEAGPGDPGPQGK